MDTSSGGHRKIELQSPDDLSYLISNVRRAAAAHIDAAFPPVVAAADANASSDSAGDELRTQIETLVAQYITRTFALAAPNLTVNGLPVAADASLFLDGGDGKAGADEEEEQEQHEPFDGRKRMRVEDLSREEEDLLREIAALKRRVPRAAAAAWAGRVRDGVAADEAELERWREEAVGDGRAKGSAPSSSSLLADVRPLERQADVERAFAGAVAALGRLKTEMPATVAKMERARVAGEYVVTER